MDVVEPASNEDMPGTKEVSYQPQLRALAPDQKSYVWVNICSRVDGESLAWRLAKSYKLRNKHTTPIRVMIVVTTTIWIKAIEPEE